jgi:preprotein translocase subunit SecB
MENNITQSDFRLVKYIVNKSVIELKEETNINDEFSININPSGIKKEKKFYLKLEVSVEDKSKSYSVFVSMIGIFEFKGDVERISDYFLINAPAILFPYIRAYISSLTSISGVETVILPTLNLTQLKETLFKNITYEN